MDTDATTQTRLLGLLRGMSPAKRLASALALTALTRDLAWQGALLHAGHAGATAVLDRFLRQLYGPECAAWIASRRATALSGE